jgi:outer membrane receptor protein involved in Fe transport
MNKFIGLCFLVLIASLTAAQNPTAPGAGNRGGMGGGQMPGGRFYGKIVDAKTGKPVEYASVELFQNKMDTATKKRKETVISGMLTKTNGEFSLENIPVFGQSKLKITAIGYKAIEQTVAFDLKSAAGGMANAINALDKDLGNIKMQIDENVLAGVTVTASRSALTLAADKKIFNVDKNLVSAGGTAEDVMKNVPSVQVDVDGNVTLRNNAPQIFVDNRPTTLSLDQIPADAIESIEIITNPSAKYDASGGQAGILNIVLKKNRKAGYNGSIRSSIDSRARVGLNGDINIRTEKFNFFLNGNFNQRKSISNGETERTSLIGTPNTFLTQNDRSETEGSMRGVRGGFDYFLNNRNTISFSGNSFRGSFSPFTQSDIWIDSLYNVKTSSLSQRFANTSGLFRNKGAQISYKHLFPKAGREWTADINYNNGRNNNENLVTTNYYTIPQNALVSTYAQQQKTNGDNKSVVLQSDFVNPITDKSKMELGVRMQVRDINSDQKYYYIDQNTGMATLIPMLSTKYTSRDHVYAAYGTYSNQLKNFNYQVGLRVESSDYNGNLPDKGEEFTINFPVSLFPSLGFTVKVKEDQDLQFNYSRRVNRPNFFQLFPFTDYSDSLNLNRGNPNLKPEFTNSAELSYSKTFKNKDNFLASVYYKRTENLITRYQQKEVNPYTTKDVLVNTYINANSSYVTGLELVSKNKITKWWDLTSNFNLFTSKINIDDPALPETDQFISWFAKMNNTFKLPKNFSFQLSGEYQSKTVLPPGGSGGGGGFGGGGRGGGGGMMFGSPQSTAQGYNKPNYFVDLAVRYEFLKEKRAAISVNWSDIFRTRRTFTHSESQYFIQDALRRRDGQVVRVNFSWRFGKFDMNLFKRKNTRTESEDNSGMMQ